ncbi:hypothetical protein SAMN02745148_02393 [Modicisalibacter ilicicola DSM 19980]|uniref:Uncharacterized protein n=1 Tax=Modicisalibacter ilicicola DSM 19980 TaxID=1121942 RepID=A0A1M5AYV4_9GAMM|nr:hypothetical protein [Halomonas ilicicola]SHF35267.1 hypothetical protein SAMN02745148_02393 [Halomonas ilicicola DSM 19980]
MIDLQAFGSRHEALLPWGMALAMAWAVPMETNAQYPGAEPADWPCEQRLIPELAWGTLWAGPSLDALERQWWEDEEVGAVVRFATARQTPRDAALERVRDFVERVASEPQANADHRLTLLFAGLFERLDRERSRIIDRIRSAARAQVARLERISGMVDRLEALRASENASDAAIERLQKELYWERQVFQMRQQALPALCEKPYLLEETLSRMVRTISAQM